MKTPPYSAALIALAAAALASCANVEHAKGRAQVKLDYPEEGVASLERATRMAPTDPEYRLDYLLKKDEAVQSILASAGALRSDGKPAEAKAAYERVLKLDRGNAIATAALAQMSQEALNAKAAEIERAKAAQVKPLLDKPVTLQFNDAPLRTVFEAISRSTGLNVLMDRDVKPNFRVTIFVKDVAVGDAIDFVLMQNQLERRQMNGNTVIVYPSNDAKKAEYEDLTIQSFQVTNADIRYLSTMLKSMLKLREVAADERSGVLVIRDTPEKLNLASRLIAVHDVADPEIMLEVEILEVSTTRSSNLGILPPQSITVSTPGTAGSLTLGALKQLRTNDLLVTPLAATLNFKLEDVDAQLLAAPRIRARNREKAKIMIGDRVPTITNTVTPLTTGSSVVTGSVSYQDVGLKLEIEPQVYAGSEVGIKVSLEVSNIAAEYTDGQGGRSYQIGTRNASTNLRLKDGETQVLGGLISDEDRNTASKIPGLGHLPVIGRLFGNNQGSGAKSEIVLAITPRIVRNLADRPADVKSIFSGTLNGLRDKPILAEPLSQLKFSPATGTPGGVTSAPLLPNAAPVAAPAGPPGVLFNPAPSPSAPLPPPPAMAPRPAASTPR